MMQLRRGLVVVVAMCSGCAMIPGYTVMPEELGKNPTVARRISDGATVKLIPDSYRPSGEPSPDRSVVVRGPGRHSKRWLAGAILSGLALGLTATGLGILGSGNDNSGARLGAAAPFIVLGGLSALVGPPLWIAGARARPEETP